MFQIELANDLFAMFDFIEFNEHKGSIDGTRIREIVRLKHIDEKMDGRAPAPIRLNCVERCPVTQVDGVQAVSAVVLEVVHEYDEGRWVLPEKQASVVTDILVLVGYRLPCSHHLGLALLRLDFVQLAESRDHREVTAEAIRG